VCNLEDTIKSLFFSNNSLLSWSNIKEMRNDDFYLDILASSIFITLRLHPTFFGKMPKNAPKCPKSEGFVLRPILNKTRYFKLIVVGYECHLMLMLIEKHILKASLLN
jgi:hypothetical protein